VDTEQDGPKPDPDDVASALASASIAAGDPTGWFEQLYAKVGRGEAGLPWDRETAHPLLIDWEAGRHGDGARAVVVGCGPGHDAEYLAGLGFAVTAFDISASAIEQVRARRPGSKVTYTVADLLALPSEWSGGFDLVVEAMTVQSMPRTLRPRATAAVSSLVAPGGTLLVIGVYLPPGAPLDEGPPFLLTHAEVAAFGADGLGSQGVVEAQLRDSDPPRYLAEFNRPAANVHGTR
jgi:SAM-dependent methyltransferase